MLDSILQATSGILPEPLSPYFQTGGRFEWLNEDLGFTVFFMLCLGVIDLLIVRPFLQPKSRYFFLHACANAVCALAAFPDVRRAFTEVDTFSGPSYSIVANSAAAAIHLYHCVAFDLRAEDIFHHVAFTAVGCGLAIPFKRAGGILSNFGAFFLCGVPGGIDYVLLVLVKEGYMDKTTEKRWCATINTWLRGPSMSMSLFMGIQAFVRQTYDMPTVVLFAIMVLHFYNGQYYAAQAVAALAVYEERAKVAAKNENRGEKSKISTSQKWVTKTETVTPLPTTPRRGTSKNSIAKSD